MSSLSTHQSRDLYHIVLHDIIDIQRNVITLHTRPQPIYNFLRYPRRAAHLNRIIPHPH